MCVVWRMTGAQALSVVRWLFGCGLVGGFDCAIVLSFSAMPGLLCFLHHGVTQVCCSLTSANRAWLYAPLMRYFFVPARSCMLYDGTGAHQHACPPEYGVIFDLFSFLDPRALVPPQVNPRTCKGFL